MERMKCVELLLALGLVFSLTAEERVKGKGFFGSEIEGGMVLSVPGKINFQGYLTDTLGNPLAGDYTVKFRIYSVPSGGTALWMETQTVTVEEGVLNVLLGSINPIPNSVFTGDERWLELEIEGETMIPRTEMASVGYSYRANYADTALYAEKVAIQCPLSLSCSVPLSDGVINLENMGTGYGIQVNSAGQAGVHVGTSDYGVSVDSATVGFQVGNALNDGFVVTNADDDGFVVVNAGTEGIWVQNAGSYGLQISNAGSDGIYIGTANYGVYVDSTRYPHDAFRVRHARGSGLRVELGDVGVYVDSTADPYSGALHVRASRGYGLLVQKAMGDGVYIGSAGAPGYTQDGIRVGYAGNNGIQIDSVEEEGVYVGNAGDNALFVSSAGTRGLWVYSAGTEGVNVSYAGNDGIRVANAGQNGVRVVSADNYGVYVENSQWGGVVASSLYLGASCYGKRLGGQFSNDTTGVGYPALRATNYYGGTSNERIADFWAGTDLRFYFRGDGYAYADGGWNTFKKNRKGDYESFSSVEAERPEIVSHGTGRLVDGVGSVTFNSSFSEFLTDEEPIEIIVTPVGSYSGLYIEKRSRDGFRVKSGAGDPNCEFTWIAIGVERDKEERLTVGNIEEEERVAMEMTKGQSQKRYKEMGRSSR